MLLTIRLADEKAVPYLTYEEKVHFLHAHFPGEIASEELDTVTGIVTFTLSKTLTDEQSDYLHLSDEARLVDAYKTEDAPQTDVRVRHEFASVAHIQLDYDTMKKLLATWNQFEHEHPDMAAQQHPF